MVAMELRRLDLNETRSPLDKKLYRHVTLPNGLQAVLIEDTVALQMPPQSTTNGRGSRGGGRNGTSSSGSRSKPTSRTTSSRGGDDDDSDEENGDDGDSSDEDDDEDDDNNGNSAGGGYGGLRDAACAVLIGGGSASDPCACPGLAHFLEHLLFMGSSKYPVENEYESFVALHGGGDNAFTEWEYTIFNLDIPQSFLWGAVDRLSQFFIHPLLSSSAVDRELRSVESEFLLHQKSDSTRLQQLFCDTFRPDHPMHNFAWGNLDSLSLRPAQHGVDPMTALREFFETHYYATNMKVVIQAAQSLDRLEENLIRYFGDIPSLPRNGSPPGLQTLKLKEAGLPWPVDNDAPKIYRVIPIKDRHSVTVTWQLPSQLYDYRTKRTDILSHLLGHEASGSILSHVKRHYEAIGCNAGLDDQNNATSHALFSISVSLNQIDHWQDIVRTIYAYLNMLRQDGVPPYVYEELRDIATLSYRYADEEDPGDVVEDIAEAMLLVPDAERILDGLSLYYEFDWDGVEKLMECMIPSTGRIHLFSSSFVTAGDRDDLQTEEWFGTQYWTENVTDEMVHEWAHVRLAELTPPPPNPFVPTDFTVKATSHPLVSRPIKVCITIGKRQEWVQGTVVDYSQPRQSIQVCYEDGDEKWHKLDDVESYASGTLDGRTSKFRLGGSDNNTSAFPAIPPASKDLPKEIFCSSALRLWWLQDRKYQRPNTALLLEIVCQKALQDPTYAAVADLMVDLVVDALTETTYMAEMCELSNSIEATDVGFQIHLTGFNEKLPALLTQTLDMFFSFKNEVPLVMKSRYDTCLSALQRYYRNQGVKVSDFAEDIRIEAIRSALPSSNKRLQALSEFSAEQFFSIAKGLLSVYAVEALLHGNEDEDDAKRISTTLLRYTSDTGLARKNYPPQSILKIPSVRSPTILRVPSKNPDANTTCEVYLQISKDNVRDRVLVDLLTEIMHEPLYDQVRTKDQFGYDVGVDSRWSHGIIGCLFYVTTNVKSADDVMDRIDRFLLDFRVTLDEMSDADYNDHLIGLANRYLDMYNSMDEETSTYWSEIVNGRFEWEGWREETSILIQTPKTEVIEAFDKWFKPGTERRIMAVQVIGTEPQVCCGRPETSDTADAYADSMVGMFHGKCKTQQWGRVNSKLR